MCPRKRAGAAFTQPAESAAIAVAHPPIHHSPRLAPQMVVHLTITVCASRLARRTRLSGERWTAKGEEGAHAWVATHSWLGLQASSQGPPLALAAALPYIAPLIQSLVPHKRLAFFPCSAPCKTWNEVTACRVPYSGGYTLGTIVDNVGAFNGAVCSNAAAMHMAHVLTACCMRPAHACAPCHVARNEWAVCTVCPPYAGSVCGHCLLGRHLGPSDTDREHRRCG